MPNAKVISLTGHINQRGAEDLSVELIADLAVISDDLGSLIGKGIASSRAELQDLVEDARKTVVQLEMQLMLVEAFQTNRYEIGQDATGASVVRIDESLVVERMTHDDDD